MQSIEVTSSLAEYLGSDWPGCARVFRLTRVRKTGEEVETEVVLGITIRAARALRRASCWG